MLIMFSYKFNPVWVSIGAKGEKKRMHSDISKKMLYFNSNQNNKEITNLLEKCLNLAKMRKLKCMIFMQSSFPYNQFITESCGDL